MPWRDRGATVCAAEKLRALRARQTKSTHAARRTEVTPPKTSDCEGACVCFERVSMLAREGKAPRPGADTTRLGTAGDCDRAWDSACSPSGGSAPVPETSNLGPTPAFTRLAAWT